MAKVVLKAGMRTSMTRSERSRIRRSGGVIANLYGRNTVPKPIYIEADSVNHLLQHGRGLVDVSIQGDGIFSAMIQSIDQDPIRKTILHVDFHSVDMNELVDAEVPIILNGLEKVEKTGAVIMQLVRELSLRALPTDIPEYLLVDISNMSIGDNLTAGKIPLPSECRLMNDPSDKIVMIVAAHTHAADAPEVPKEPEIVHKEA